MSPLFVKKYQSINATRGTLLLLHGWGFDHRCWQPSVPYLQQEYDLLLVDLPGFGDSSPLAVDSAEAWLEQTLVLLEQQIEAAACHRQALSIAGWSLGGQLALRLLQRDSRIQSALGIATNLQFCAKDTWSAAMNAQQFSKFLQNFSLQPEATLKGFSRLVSAGDMHLRKLRTSVVNLLASFDSSLACNWFFALQSLQLLDHTQVTFDRPVLLLLSENDALVPIALAHAVAGVANIQCQCLAQASHGHVLIEPELVVKAMLGFLDAT